jgi:hypothetical protein
MQPSDYQSALDVQTACNASGVINSLSRLMPAIWDEARQSGQGTDYVNRHPIVILYLNQLVWLATADCISPSAFYAAQKVCEERAALARTGGDNANV